MSLRDELNQVRAQYGRVTKVTIEHAARPVNHPMHHRFEWNDAAGAYQYRLIQASELMRQVRCNFISPSSGLPTSVRAFHSVRMPNNSTMRTYEPIEDIVADPIAYQTLVAEMRRDWAAFQGRYAHLVEFVTLINNARASAATP